MHYVLEATLTQQVSLLSLAMFVYVITYICITYACKSNSASCKQAPHCAGTSRDSAPVTACTHKHTASKRITQLRHDSRVMLKV
jgi:hypothetical protein